MACMFVAGGLSVVVVAIVIAVEVVVEVIRTHPQLVA
jgi:hypothetical protein